MFILPAQTQIMFFFYIFSNSMGYQLQTDTVAGGKKNAASRIYQSPFYAEEEQS